ncbi:Hypothetical predicted protein [Marmota monax]|uniref:Uncharacterized protein n=1 Tax=Marmota monax TaxID=9995 RepID=A0A5E4ABR9_MARMO|nr:Hypothetical predicted protein [Marmota monax]
MPSLGVPVVVGGGAQGIAGLSPDPQRQHRARGGSSWQRLCLRTLTLSRDGQAHKTEATEDLWAVASEKPVWSPESGEGPWAGEHGGPLALTRAGRKEHLRPPG